jgi:hypothetical protein
LPDISALNGTAIDNVAEFDGLTVTDVPAFVGLLDTYTGAAAGYSTRRLASSATNLMRIREDSGDTETDIGYDSNGDLDTAAIATHCGTANGFVVSWVDQSGNANDADQSTLASQPKIYNGTAVITDNGQPALEFNQDGFAPITGSKSDILFHTSTQGMLYNVGNYTASQNGLRIIAETNGTSSNKSGFVMGIDDRAGTGGNDYGYYGLTKGTGSANAISAIQEASFVGAQYLMAIHYDFASGIFQYQNGSLLDSATASKAYGTGDATNDLSVGSSAGFVTLIGKMQELVLYNDDDTNRTGIEGNQNAHYQIGNFGTPTSGLLATYTGAAAAYSVRQLANTAALSMRVREDATDTETNIGFDANGDLDTAAIAAHCGTANGYVVNWYDQAGSQNDATQSTSTNQPQIYNGTAVITVNGKPGMSATSTTQQLVTSNSLTTTSDGDATVAAVFYQDSGENVSPNIVFGQHGGAAIVQWMKLKDTELQSIYRDTTGSIRTLDLNVSYTNAAQQLGVVRFNGTSGELHVNNTSSSGTLLGSPENKSAPVTVTGRSGQEAMIGTIQEVIFYNSAKDYVSGLKSNINTYFSIY